MGEVVPERSVALSRLKWTATVPEPAAAAVGVRPSALDAWHLVQFLANAPPSWSVYCQVLPLAAVKSWAEAPNAAVSNASVLAELNRWQDAQRPPLAATASKSVFARVVVLAVVARSLAST